MASKTSNRSGPINFDVNPSPETMYHFPISPSEPGKFDFYRVHLANNASYSNSMFSDNCDAPTLAAPITLSSIAKRRWTPFADIVSLDQSKSLSSPKSQTVSSINSSVLSNTNGVKNESVQTVSSLTDTVKNALNKGYLDAPSKQIRRPASGTTLSTKDLNHLSPQSM